VSLKIVNKYYLKSHNNNIFYLNFFEVMQYRQLGKSGLIVSELTLGAMLFGEGDYYGLKYTIDQPTANDMVAKVMDAGINFFDTAHGYNNGVSEQMLGKALGKRRQEALVATKVFFRSNNTPFRGGISGKNLIESTEESLRRLGTDYVDVLMLHNDDHLTPLDEVLRALENLTQRGLVRYTGVSNYSAWKTATLAQRQYDLNFTPMVASQMHYSLLNREVEQEFVPMSQHHGLGMMVWSPLSSGFLTGKYSRQNPKPEEARLNTFDLGLFDREKAYDVVEIVKSIAVKHQTTPTAISIAWLLTRPAVSTVIVGVSKMSQLDDNLAATKVTLDVDDLSMLDEATKPVMRYPKTFEGIADSFIALAKRFS
jgi:aryl-alcohol dehydrogenase-like predicted oxidoreductase